jgi:hypothetical protein
MANTKITADNLAANAVTSASIADNSIGITQLNVSDGTNGQVLTTNGSGTLSFSTISGYTDSDVESYLNTSAIYTDPTNDRLGLGTSSPMVTLNVHNATNPRIALTNSTTGQTFPSGLELLLADSDAYISQRENADLIFSTNNTERLRIDSTGSVGINNTNPSSSYKLDIAGKQRIVNNADPFALTLERTAATTGAFGLGLDGDGAYRLSTPSLVYQQIDGTGISYYRSYTDMIFMNTTSNTERMRVRSDGGVSVSNDGQMGYSGSKFHVKGTAFTTSDSSGNNTGGFSTFSGYKSVSNSATTLFTLDRSNGAHSGIIIITKSEAGDSASTIYSFAANYAQTVDIDILSSATAVYTGFTLSASMNGGQTLTVQLTHGAAGSKNYTYTVLYGGSALATTPTLY